MSKANVGDFHIKHMKMLMNAQFLWTLKFISFTSYGKLFLVLHVFQAEIYIVNNFYKLKLLDILNTSY